MVITSLENRQIKNFSKLKNKKYRDEERRFLVEGEHLLLEAKKKNLLEAVILLEGALLSFDFDPIYIVTEAVMEKLSSLDTPPAMMGICRMKEEKLTGERLLVIDGIQDPGNLGTMIRSAKAFGIDSIILLEDTVDLYNSKVVRATQGLLFTIPIVKMDLSTFLDTISHLQIPLYATRVDQGMDVRSLTREEKKSFALVMGNEGSGVRQEIFDICTKYLYITMDREVESLNVAIATSILLYELGRGD